MANNKKKSRSSFGILFWIAVILLFLVVFVATKPRIQEVVQSTGLMNVLQHRFGKDGSGTIPGVETQTVVIGTDKNSKSAPKNGVPGKPGLVIAPTAGGTGRNSGTATDANPATSITPPSADGNTTFRTVPGLSGDGSNSGTPSTPVPGKTGPTAAKPPADQTGPQYRVRSARLYYTFVTDDGRIVPEAVNREVRYIDSPLTDTIRALLKGPTPEELNKGVLNLIPPKTRLLSAYVQNGIAYLDFNEAFEFNTMGVEGFIAQLKEIVHTATEFSTVSRVQFLVNGKKLDYLGGEGIYIGRPLGRDSFS